MFSKKMVDFNQRLNELLFLYALEDRTRAARVLKKIAKKDDKRMLVLDEIKGVSTILRGEITRDYYDRLFGLLERVENLYGLDGAKKFFQENGIEKYRDYLITAINPRVEELRPDYKPAPKEYSS